MTRIGYKQGFILDYTQSLSFVRPYFNLKASKRFYGPQTSVNNPIKIRVKMTRIGYKPGFILDYTQSLSFVRPYFNLKASKRFYGPQTVPNSHT